MSAAPTMPVCAYCGTTDGPFHDDHVVPRSRGGPDSPSNLVRACATCKCAKSDLLPSEWLALVPDAVARIERNVSSKVEVKIRNRRGPRTDAEEKLSGLALLEHETPICPEDDRRVCGRPATWEVNCGHGWSPRCPRCARFYGKSREILSQSRLAAFILAQLRDGTLDVSRESTIGALARAGGVSTEEYIDIALRICVADARACAALKSAFPSLRLNVWNNTTEAQ